MLPILFLIIIIVSAQELLKVHLFVYKPIHHGWLKTYEQYYNGDQLRLDNQCVKCELDSLVQALAKEQSRKYIWGEVSFFNKWWDQQNQQTQDLVKQLVKSGQLEFVNGGWVINDEASTYFVDIINQLNLGQSFLHEKFQTYPKIGWQVGYSKSLALLLTDMGYEALFISRATTNENSKEFVYQDSLFTHMLNQPYKLNLDQNVQEIGEDLAQFILNQTIAYRGRIVEQIIQPTGSDMDKWFNQVEKIIKFINNNPWKYQMQLEISTPSIFLQELRQQDLPYPNEYSDSYQGYYTNRPAFKGYLRSSSQFLQQITTFFSINQNSTIKNHLINYLDELISTCQEQNIIGGNQEEAVMKNQIQQISQAIQTINNEMNQILKTYNTNLEEGLEYETCSLIETSCIISYQTLAKNRSLIITFIDLKDPLQFKQDKIKLKVPKKPLKIIDQRGERVNGDILCLNEEDPEDCELHFIYQLNDSIIYNFKITPNYQDSSAWVLNISESIDLSKSQKVPMQLGKAPLFHIHYGQYLSASEEPEFNASRSFEYGRPYKSFKMIGQILQVQVIYGYEYQTTIINYNNIDQYEIESQINGAENDIVLVIDTNIRNGNTFYTDSNGLNFEKRIRKEHVGAQQNYYPVSTMIQIKDESSIMTVITDRPQGGTSLMEGQIELMIKRKIPDETEFTKQKIIHQLTFNNNPRILQYLRDFQPISYYSKTNSDEFVQIQQKPQNTLLATLMKINQHNMLNRVSIKPYANNSFLIRVQNIQEKENTYFYHSVPVYEISLTAQEIISQHDINDTVIKPLQIRTFVYSDDLKTLKFDQQYIQPKFKTSDQPYVQPQKWIYKIMSDNHFDFLIVKEDKGSSLVSFIVYLLLFGQFLFFVYMMRIQYLKWKRRNVIKIEQQHHQLSDDRV